MDLIIFKCLKGDYKEDGLFTVASGDRTRNNDFTFPNIGSRGKNFLLAREVQYWNRLPKEVVNGASLEIFKSG